MTSVDTSRPRLFRCYKTDSWGVSSPFGQYYHSRHACELASRAYQSRFSLSFTRFRVEEVSPREVTRLMFDCDDSIFTRVSWFGLTWFNEHATHYHYARVSSDNPNQVAFFASEDHLERDRWTRMSPGRFLKKYYGNVLTDAQITYWAEYQLRGGKADMSHVGLQLAHDPDEIEAVYEHGPESCMSGSVENFNSDMHPVRVYGAGDLAVAYLSGAKDTPITDAADNRVFARVLVYPARKIFGRIYPTVDRWREDSGLYTSQEDAQAYNSALENMLIEQGYSSYRTHTKGFDGARLLRIEVTHNGNRFIAPYLDGDYGVDDDGDYLTMSRHGSINCDNQTGFSEEVSHITCDVCGDRVGEDETYTLASNVRRGSRGQAWYDDISVCEYCYNHKSFHCEVIDADVHDGDTERRDIVSQRGEKIVICETLADRFDHFYCDNTGVYYHSRYYTTISVTVDKNGYEETWCLEKCRDDFAECEVTSYFFAKDLLEIFEFDGVEHCVCKDEYMNLLDELTCPDSTEDAEHNEPAHAIAA